MFSRSIFGLLAAAMLGAPGAASATVLYSNDFEWGSPGPEWSGIAAVSFLPAYTQYMGRFSGVDATMLTVAAPAVALGPGESLLYTVEFDFYVIDSWDGYEPTMGEDWLKVYANGELRFDETFANQHTMQSFRPPDIGPVHLGYNPSFKDSTYRDIAAEFEAPGANTLAITWQGHAMQGIADESWGIDNVTVSYTVIPAPGAAAVMGTAGLLMLRRRR